MRTLDDLNPITAALCLLFAAVIPMISRDPYLLSVSLLASVCLFTLRDKRVRGRARSHIFCLLLFFVTAAVNPLVSQKGSTVLLVINHRPLTLEATVFGLVSAAALVGAIYWFRSFSDVMTSEKLLYLTGRLSPRLSLLVSMALRYVPLFKKRSEATERAQRATGLYKDENAVDRVRGRASVLSATLSWSLENGITTADSMAARGYGVGRRTSFSTIRMGRGDLVLLILAASLFCPALFAVLLGATEPSFYPTVTLCERTALAIIGRASYTALASLPILYETEERIKWKYLTSRI